MHCTRVLYKVATSRIYHYDLSIHGALFLSSTPLSRRASITAYRDPNFLRIFYARLRRNEENEELRKEGFEWVSHCAGEANFLRPAKDGTAIVFDDLVGGDLTYGAGSLSTQFSPSSLRASLHTGYLFHPSPIPRRSTATSPYGPYSLLRSALVLDHFAGSLELDEKSGGTYEYEGERYEIGTLKDDDVWWRKDY
ncbi:hypothetical protein JCM5353_005351 [Sporobolomyces roseus]